MVLIGLWHGITFNFIVWGLWHGIGLFGHKMLADRTRGWHNRVSSAVWSRRLIHGLSVVFTFHYVTLGWVFFALPEFSQSWSMFTRMLGISS
jgi:alginate O-acetyltransferase complex protein AlgI